MSIPRVATAAALIGCMLPSFVYAQTVDATTSLGAGPATYQQGARSDIVDGFKGNFITGFVRGRTSTFTTRGYLTFNLTGVTTPVSSAELLTPQGIVLTPDAFETLNIYDVTTPAADLNSIAASADIYNDLGTGILFGSSSDFASGNDFVTLKSITLNAAAIDAINANLGGFFSVGLSLTTIDPVLDENELIFQATEQTLPVLRMTLVPEPSAFALAASSLVALSLMRRRR